MKLTVGITGATGVIYGIRLLEALKEYDITSYLIISKWAQETIKLETDYQIDYVYSLADRTFCNDDLSAALSSGSFHTDGMVIAPCSMKTVAGIASGYTDNLIIRAADVTLKECRKLVLMARETPLNVIHLENMFKLAKAGVVIMPPVPSFYSRPKTIDDIVNHTVGRILDLFGIYDNNLAGRWQNESGDKK